MTLQRILQEKNISGYRLSKDSRVPYMTIHDLITNKSSLTKCNAETVFRIAKALGTSVEELLEPCLKPRISFELFKSNVCHRLKELGDIDFLSEVIGSDTIPEYYDLEWYPECLYLLAMTDYISRINGIPLCSDYDHLRVMRLTSVLYPASVLAEDLASNSNEAKEKALRECIPEFKRYNIVENEVRNIV